jgi:hypothetical protein
MAPGVPLELSPEEQSFFDAGDAIDEGPAPEQHRRRRHHHSHHSHRHSRPSLVRQFRNRVRQAGWRRVARSLLLVAVTVMVGYFASMLVIERAPSGPYESHDGQGS